MEYFPFIYEKKKPKNEPIPLYKEIEAPQYTPLPLKEEETETERVIIIEL